MSAPVPLLSLVIPTRNRPECMTSLLAGIAASEAPELDVVVQDNSDDDSLGRFVRELGDARIRYFHRAERLSMHQNFDAAIAMATGEFVCVIGDDDGIVVAESLAVLRRAKALGASAVLTDVVSFRWPGVVHRFWGEIGGPAYIVRRGLGEQLIDPEQALDDVYANGAVDGLGMLPRVYHGYVSRAALTALFDRCGTYFPGGSPDIANAVALAAFVDKMLFDPGIALISGHSPRSGGGEGAAGVHHGELEQAAHLPAETIRDWDPAIPRFWCGTTIYAQSVISAARAVGLQPDRPFNYMKVCVACLIYQPARYRDFVQAALRSLGKGRGAVWPVLARDYLAMLAGRGRTFIRNVGQIKLGLGAFDRFANVGEMMTRLADDPTPLKS